MSLWADQLVSQLVIMKQSNFYLHNVELLNICMKEFGSININV